MVIINQQLQAAGVPSYTAIRKTSGRPQVDRMISKNALDKFSLYGSIVFGTDRGSPFE